MNYGDLRLLLHDNALNSGGSRVNCAPGRDLSTDNLFSNRTNEQMRKRSIYGLLGF